MVSPEFRLRPSLSGRVDGGAERALGGVAGVQTPAFVERVIATPFLKSSLGVSPEFRLRPSLSGSPTAKPCSATLQCRRSSDSGLR